MTQFRYRTFWLQIEKSMVQINCFSGWQTHARDRWPPWQWNCTNSHCSINRISHVFNWHAHLTLPYLTLPYLTLPCLALPCIALPCLALPYLTLPYLTVPYLTLPNLTLRCRYTIQFAGAEPCDCPVHRPIVTCGMLVECSGPMKIGWLWIRARSILQPILSHLLSDYPIRTQ